MNPKPRRVVLGVVLAGSLAAARWVASQDSAVDAAPRGSAPQSARSGEMQPRPAVETKVATRSPEPQETLQLERLRRGASTAGTTDPFAVAPPPAPATRSAERLAPPPAPVAPPLPFKYFGKLTEDGRTTVFLIGGNRSLAVREGDVLDGQYRIERIADSSVAITYLPLNQQQTLQTSN